MKAPKFFPFYFLKKSLPIFFTSSLLSSLTLMLPNSAKADLIVCNTGSSRAFTAISYRRDHRWFTQAWFLIQPNQCFPVYQGSVSGKQMLIHAQTESGGVIAEGPNLRCIIYYQQQQSYTIGDSNNPNRCQATNRGMASFRAIDVTNDYNSRFDLTD